MALHPASEALTGSPLDLHEGIATKAPTTRGCPRWPEHLQLLNQATGELFPGLCRATRKCAYCGMRGAVENAEMVALDAVEAAPSTFVVLTTRNPGITLPEVHRALQLAVRAVRREVAPDFGYACFVEFTTGLSVWSGGHRRIHLNLLCKGVYGEHHDDLERVLRRTWGKATDTTQLHVGPIYAAEGLVSYVTNLALHVMKDGQKPPASYEGHLVRWSRNYFARGATAMRAEAQRSLRVKRLIYKGADAAEAELEVAAAQPFALVKVGDVPAPLRWGDTGRIVRGTT